MSKVRHVSCKGVNVAPAVLFGGHSWSASSHNVERLLRTKHGLTNLVVERVSSAKPQEVSALLPRADVFVPLMSRLNSADLPFVSKKSGNGRLALVHQWGVGLEGVDLEAASKEGIIVAHTPSTPETATSTAEVGALLLLMGFRRLLSNPHNISSIQEKDWGGGRVRGKTVFGSEVAILGGRGAVGSALTRILQGFNCTVRHVDSRSSEVDVACAVAGVDALILCAPLNSSTREVVDHNVLKGLGSRSVLINVGRGGLVTRKAVQEALDTGALGGFCTDVWWSEPPSPEDDFLRHPKLLFTPHIGGSTDLAGTLNDERCAQGIADFLLRGALPEFAVNRTELSL